jgi:hypothetical protein
LNRSVETPATTIVLYATARHPGPVFTQRIMARAAIRSFHHDAAAPTTIRRLFSRKAEVAEAST